MVVARFLVHRRRPEVSEPLAAVVPIRRAFRFTQGLLRATDFGRELSSFSLIRILLELIQ